MPLSLSSLLESIDPTTPSQSAVTRCDTVRARCRAWSEETLTVRVRDDGVDEQTKLEAYISILVQSLSPELPNRLDTIEGVSLKSVGEALQTNYRSISKTDDALSRKRRLLKTDHKRYCEAFVALADLYDPPTKTYTAAELSVPPGLAESLASKARIEILIQCIKKGFDIGGTSVADP